MVIPTIPGFNLKDMKEIEIPLASTDKYEEALSKARFEYEKNPCASEGEKRLLEIIFPELRESDEERIREGLLRHFKNKTKPYWNEIAVKDIIAYLEKLKDVETEIEKAYKNADQVQYRKGFEDGVASVKPAEWSEEDEKILKNIILDLIEFRNYETDEELISAYKDEIVWLKSLRPQPHWKPSEEQMDALIDAKTRMSCDGGFPAILQTLIEDLKKL